MRPIIVALAMLAAAPLPASAQNDDARFTMERVGDNFIRLDQATGEVRLCVEGQAQAGFTCRTVVEPQAAPITAGLPAQSEVLAENERLKAEIRDLRERLSMIASLVEDIDAETGAIGASSDDAGIPSIARREIDNAVEVTGYALRRFRDLIKSLTEEENTTK